MSSLSHQYWMKAKLFTDRALDSAPDRTEDERRLWAVLALEMLGKGALAQLSPALVAKPNEEGKNLLMSVGAIGGDGQVQTVDAKTVFARCALAFRPFNSGEALKFAAMRNEYLHGSGPGLPLIPGSEWWPSIWMQAEILVHAQAFELTDLVGDERATAIQEQIRTRKDSLSTLASMMIQRGQRFLREQEEGTPPAREARERLRRKPTPLGLPFSVRHACPACGETGLLEGDTTGKVDVEYEMVGEEDYVSTVWVEIFSDAFTCPACHLQARDPDLVDALGLPSKFETEGDSSDLAADMEYGND